MTADPAFGRDAPLVDCHAHIYTLDMPLWEGAWHKPPEDATLAMYRDTLDRHGVKFAVMAAASLYADYNDFMIDACRRTRRLRTTVIVKPDIERSTMEWMDRHGACGIRFQFRGLDKQPDLTTFEYQRLLRRVRDLDWHVHLNDVGSRLTTPIEVLRKAGVKLVIDHMGRPDPARGIQCPGFQSVLRAVEGGNTWVKLSGAFRIGSPELARAAAAELLKFGGPERLFWGSDWPFANFETKIKYQDTIDALAECVPDPVARRRIGGETPLAFYFAR